MKKLHLAGLDEIRFHPDVDDDSLWERLKVAKEFDWDAGIEIPAIPGKTEEIKNDNIKDISEKFTKTEIQSN